MKKQEKSSHKLLKDKSCLVRVCEGCGSATAFSLKPTKNRLYNLQRPNEVVKWVSLPDFMENYKPRFGTCKCEAKKRGFEPVETEHNGPKFDRKCEIIGILLSISGLIGFFLITYIISWLVA